MAASKSLKTAVKKEVKQAETAARTGDVETVPQTKGGPTADLATGARSHPPDPR